MACCSRRLKEITDFLIDHDSSPVDFLFFRNQIYWKSYRKTKKILASLWFNVNADIVKRFHKNYFTWTKIVPVKIQQLAMNLNRNYYLIGLKISHIKERIASDKQTYIQHKWVKRYLSGRLKYTTQWMMCFHDHKRFLISSKMGN